jgi:hypothetical protein
MEEQMTKGFLKDKFPSMSDSDWVIVAFRYYVGRMTISACAFASDLARAWDSLPAGTRSIIQSELEDEFRRDDAAMANQSTHLPLGMDMDREAWELVRKAYTK